MISLTSPLASLSGLSFGISSHLSCISFSEADEANTVRGFSKTKDMPTNAEHANSDIAHFAIVLPLVYGIQGGLEVKLGGRIERKAAVTNVPFPATGRL
jgi:hypothetical protein